MGFFCNKYTWIIYTTLTGLLSSCLFGLNHNEAFKKVQIASDNFSNHRIIHELWNYIGTCAIAFCLDRYEQHSILQKSLNISLNKEEKTGLKGFNLIYNNYEQRGFITNSFLIIYVLNIFFWVLIDRIIESYFILLQDLDFWMIELFILDYINSKLDDYKFQIYKHQKLAMYFSIISSLLKVGSIFLSFQDDSENYTGGLPIFYKSLPFLTIPLGFLVYIALISLRSIIFLNLKWYMDIKYISHNKILTAFGGIGTIFYFIICSLSSIKFFSCKEIDQNDVNTNKINICNYITKVKKEDSNITYYYFDNFEIYFNNFSGKSTPAEIGIIFLGILLFFGNKYFSLLLIKYLTPVHVIFSIPIKFFFQKVIMVSNTIINNDNNTYLGIFEFDDKKEGKKINEFKIMKFFLDISGDIFSFVGFLIYFEIIILKCCEYDYNIRMNIIRRSTVDRQIAFEDNNSSISN